MHKEQPAAAPEPFEMRIPDAPQLQLRVHGPANGAAHSADLPTLVHLPGMHGDWTLLGPFRELLAGRVRLVETTYPRRPDWTLTDYARAVSDALADQGVSSAWILGESFSSQVAWELLSERGRVGTVAWEGLILVGGFVRHPWPWAVKLAHRASLCVPAWLLRQVCAGYGRLARRKCSTSTAAAEIDEFVARRVTKADREAINTRYRLITGSDPRDIAGRTVLPIFQLSGAFDPIVPWWHVRAWLRRYCPGFVASRVFWPAGHNVLLSAPASSASQILEWVRAR